MTLLNINNNNNKNKEKIMITVIHFNVFHVTCSSPKKTEIAFVRQKLSHGRHHLSHQNTECLYVRQEHIAAQNTKTMFFARPGLSPKKTETEFE